MIWRRALGSRALAVTALLSTMSGCFDPEIPACLSCPTGECPSGQRCVQGRCAAPGQSCASSTPELCASGRCCIAGSCFEADDDLAPVLWLDWTSLRPMSAPPSTPLTEWLDRSGFENHARADAVYPPTIIPAALGTPTQVASLPSGIETLIVDQRAGLRRLGSRDVLVLVAARLSCDVTQSNFCFMSKAGEDYVEGRPVPRGLFLRAIARDEAMAVFMGEGSSWSARTNNLNLGCDRFHLIGLRRIAGDAGQLELRLDGAVVAATAVPAGVDAATPTPALLGSGRPCGGFKGELAATIAIEGPFSDDQTCRLERFMLDRLAHAGLAVPSPGPGCP